MRLFDFCALALLVTSLASALPQDSDSEPARYTPSGRRIFSLPADSHLEQSGNKFNVVAANGSVVHVFERHSVGSSVPLEKRQSVSFAVDVSASPAFNDTLQYFNTSVVVPPAPTSFDSQLLFLTSGIVLVDDTGPFLYMAGGLQYGGTILQGGSYWTPTIFLQDLPGTDFGQLRFKFGNVVLQPGTVLDISTTINTNPPPEANFTWYELAIVSSAANVSYLSLVSDLESDGVNVAPIIPRFRAQEEGVLSGADYPAGELVFGDVGVGLTTGVPKGVKWVVNANATVQPGLSVDVQKDGATDAQIAVVFPESE
ncbi:hypothetical protein HMN09_00132300 [Mycena chlorophos]|uniref:Uncharacterized protein n=1 Tax=Mycena chlorophos TaxID=658473 RepID=A0A8H6TKH4_MYCCL|nr:hypothetical protein HMN09_00132300 [Mycena chlorophos]